jgi:hypothetical protein
MSIQLYLYINEEGLSKSELSDISISLQKELRELDLESIELVETTQPRGAKSGGAFDWGSLILTMAASGGVITGLISLLQSWLGGNSQRSITLEIDGDKLELKGLSKKDQTTLIRNWIQKHLPPVKTK